MESNYLSIDEMKRLGIKSFGKNVLISRKTSIYSPEKLTIGNDVRIDDFCILSGKITLGSFIHIAAYSALFAGDAGIQMCDFSGLSSRVTVYAVSDDYSGNHLTNPMIPSHYRGVESKGVTIDKHALIGASTVILPGTKLGMGCAIGSMSMVNKSIKPWTINVGIPCREVGQRSQELLALEEQFRKEFSENE